MSLEKFVQNYKISEFREEKPSKYNLILQKSPEEIKIYYSVDIARKILSEEFTKVMREVKVSDWPKDAPESGPAYGIRAGIFF